MWRPSCGEPTQAWPANRSSNTWSPWGSPRSSSCRSTSSCPNTRWHEKGLRNYWGYNSIGYFAPHGPYASGGDGGQQVVEFKRMVHRLHEAGIEVILDVVYNHTAEGNHLGPLLSLKGFDNPAYYRLDPHDRRHYIDYTGTGNSLNMRHAQSLQLMMDSLRYWIHEMHVDGFRFDLASTLARGLHEVDRLSSFFDLIHQDPVVNRVKLIAEPWDVGEGGYQVGNFPPLWSEWNGRYRDGVRDYWRGAEETLGDLASRLTGSSDLYAVVGSAALGQHQLRHRPRRIHARRPGVVRPQAQRSQRRAEPGRGEPQSIVELGRRGPDRRSRHSRCARRAAPVDAGHPVPVPGGADAVRRRRDRSYPGWATTTGTPRTTRSPGTTGTDVDQKLLEFVRRLIRIRSNHPTFRRRRWFQGARSGAPASRTSAGSPQTATR